MLQQLGSWRGFPTLACPGVAPVVYPLFHPDSYLPTTKALRTLITAMLNRITFFFPSLFPRIIALGCFVCSSVATWAWLGRATSWQDGKQSSGSASPVLATAQTLAYCPDGRLREQGYTSVRNSVHTKRGHLCFTKPVLYIKGGCSSAGERKGWLVHYQELGMGVTAPPEGGQVELLGDRAGGAGGHQENGKTF